MTESLAVCRDVVVEHRAGDRAVRALDGVDFDVGRGDRVAVRGRSGSGKTTLLHVLGGLVEPTSGSVEVEGKPVRSLDAAVRERRGARAVAFVFQGANLLTTFSAYENVAFASRASAAEGFGPLELLELVGLRAKADHLAEELSGGEAQRVAIARALAQRPLLLLCDEPTGQLDSDTGARVLDLLDALQREFGFSLVTATHDDEVASRLDRIVELEDGRVVA